MEEYIDILDENENITGEVRTKKDVHREGLWHKSVHIWILNSRCELLLQHRAEQKESHGGFWDISAAGHVASGESSILSALREIEEEIGIKLRERELSLLGKVTQQKVINQGTFINNEFNDIYIVKKDIPIFQMKMQKEEVQGLKYVFWKKLQKWVESGGEKLVPHPKEYKLLFEFLKKECN